MVWLKFRSLICRSTSHAQDVTLRSSIYYKLTCPVYVCCVLLCNDRKVPVQSSTPWSKETHIVSPFRELTRPSCVNACIRRWESVPLLLLSRHRRKGELLRSSSCQPTHICALPAGLRACNFSVTRRTLCGRCTTLTNQTAASSCQAVTIKRCLWRAVRITEQSA